MERKKKLCKKKRSMANSILSLILVFAMVISNLQTTSGALSTVWAAESGTETPDADTGTGSVPPDIEDSAEADEGGKAEESTPAAESSGNTEADAETGEGGKTEESTPAAETESSSTETTKESETETTGDEENKFLEEGEGDDNPAEDQVTVIVHFKNSLGWDEVAASYANHNGSDWTDGFSGDWPGIKQEIDENGYYTVTQTKPKNSGFVIIFNNNDNGQQTEDIIISSESFEGETYELWIWINDTKNNGGNYIAYRFTTEVNMTSPEISADNKVTFRYKNDSATAVYVAGSMNGWNATKDQMEKDTQTGIFTYTTESALTPGEYTYKFVVDGAWIRDPNNKLFTDDNDKNSIFIIPGDDPNKVISPEVNGNEVTFRYKNASAANVYVAGTMNGWSSTADKMEGPEDGIFTYTTNLEHGEYQYKFVVDGDWKIDPSNELYITESGGNKNSVVYVPGDKTYEYTIHYHNPEKPTAAVSEPDLKIWETNTLTTDKLYPFEKTTPDTDNNVGWLTLTVELPYTNLSIIGKPTAGNTTTGQDKEQKYTLKGDTAKAEIWYVHGSGIFDKKPMLTKIEKVDAKLTSSSMNYEQNNVLSLTINEGSEPQPIISEAYVDASALGISSKLNIDPELLAVSLSVREDIAAGTYTLPITVVGFDKTENKTSVDVDVVNRQKGENDFDWNEAVIYFMVTDRFLDGNSSNNDANGSKTYGKDNPGLYHGGDFAGVTKKLDYLKELGVNTIWITPIVDNIDGVVVNGDGKEDVPFNASYHGYWAQDFTKLDPTLGTEAEFEELIKQAHDKGMKIMVDVVLNHAGYGTESKEQFAGMLRDTKDVVESNSVLGGEQANLPDFKTEEPEVREKIIQWQVDWMARYAIDYFRVDTVKHVDSTTWAAFKNALTEENQEFKMIGEYFGAGHSSNGGTLGSGQMDSLLDFNFNDWATSFVKGDITSVESSLESRNKALNNTYLTGQFLSSHDEIGFKQNLMDNCGYSESAANAASMVAATLQITAKGQPVIYYGEEIGLTGENNYPYQTNRYDFDWQKLDEQKADGSSIYSHYKTLLAIRNEYAEVFAKGDRKAAAQKSGAKGYDVVSRSYGGTTLYVGMNLSSKPQTVTVPVGANGVGGYRDLYHELRYAEGNDTAVSYTVTDGSLTITIPAAADGGTVILIPDSYVEGLIAPELTVAKGKELSLPAQLYKVSEGGERTLVNVDYTMSTVTGVTLDNTNKTLKIEKEFKGNSIQMTAKSGDDTVDFQIKVIEETIVKLHYDRSDRNYADWNVWAWKTGAGERYEFDETDDEGRAVATIILEGRSNSVLNYIIRKSTAGNEWAEKDPGMDCYIDLSDVLYGTVHYYAESGKFPGTRNTDEAVLGIKIRSVKYDEKDNCIKVSAPAKITETDNAFILKRSDGTEIAITKVELAKEDEDKKEYEYVLSIDADLSGMEEMQKEYFLVYDGYEYPVTMPVLYSSDTFEKQYTYTGSDLGATWSNDKTTFKVWAPTADKVQVKLYESGTEGANDLKEALDMTQGEKGVWTAEKEGDLNGTYYTYSVTVDGATAEACDPYARTTGVNGNRAMVINLNATNPAGWDQDRGPNAGMSYTDSVIYELHVRDFSIKENSGISDEHKGKFLGLVESGTTNGNGQPTGLDYLTDLGITHIHLLPSYDYATVDETNLDKPQFNWGYDPKNYNVPEGSYSTDPYNGAVRVKEMKQMVKTLHDNNINVIMDVVYNHVYDADEFCFNQIVPQYFSRTNADGSYSSTSGCGNDTASERAMVKKYIVDSVNYWADEYHIDGFRFDLVGLLDTETINEVVETVHKDHPYAVFYGEGWDMDSTAVSKDRDKYPLAKQGNSDKTPKFAFFSDTIRDLLKGHNDETSLGFVSGLTGKEKDVADSFMANPWWTNNPSQVVNYASCHDNYTLKDKLNATAGKTNSEEDVIKMNNLTAAIYMTAEGIPLIHAGEEILRIKVDENEKIIHNSYNSPDSVNQIKWEDLDKEEYRAVRDYYKGLIAFRKNHAALRLTSAEDVKNNVSYKWVANNVVMFVINGKDKIDSEVSDGIVVIFNATKSDKSISLYDYGIEEGTWNVCINDKKAGTDVLEAVTDGSVTVAPISAMVLVKGETVDPDSVYGKNDSTERQRSELRDLIALCENEDIKAEYFTEESWTVFQEALTSAKDIVDADDATQAQLVDAKTKLKAAYDALEAREGVVVTAKLNALITECQKIVEKGQGDYTLESWTVFTDALKAAENILAKEDKTQQEVDEAYQNLEAARNGLTMPKPDLESLSALIEEYEGLKQGKYTDESWKAFTDALEAAKAVIAKPDATQEEINTAEENLKAAFNGLKVPDGVVDTGKLELLISNCEKIEAKGQGKYTDKSWNAFRGALEDAKAILEKQDATQEDVDTAYSKLETACNGLTDVEIPDKPDVPEGLWTKWAEDSGLEDIDGEYHVTYTGKALKPAILVYDGATLLKEKTDYTVSYKNNTNAGTATVTIKGKGNYSESFVRNFTIDPVDMESLEIDDLYALVKVSDGQVQGTVALKPVVKYNGKTLKLKTDYTVDFENSGDGKTPGTYPVKVTAVNKNFKNYKLIDMTIADKASAVSMSKVTIAKIQNQPYEWDNEVGHGKIQQPEVTVSYKGTSLTSDEYTVKYDKIHTEAGQTATITVKGKGIYVGEKKVSFKITGQALKANMVNVPSEVSYTGEAQKPDVTVNLAEKPYAQYAVEYLNNINAGKATVIVKGINGYTGTVKKTFKITAYDISQDSSQFKYGTNGVIDAVPYAKGGVRLADTDVNAQFVTVTGIIKSLEQGRDYTLSYKNHTKVGTASVTIKGKGNFKGTIKDISFTINKQSLNKLNITANDILVKNAKKYNKVVPVIKDVNGKALKNKTDFKIDGYVVADSSATPSVGTEVTINITGTGVNYEGSASAVFKVIANDKNIAKAVVKLKRDQIYTGKEVRPGKDDIEVTMKVNGQSVPLTPDDYEIVSSGYSNNIKKGTAKLTIHGIGEYGGTKTASFKISAQPMDK